MSEMVERVARAILKARFFDREPAAYNSLGEFYRTLDPEHIHEARDEARAAIEAMREPTKAMTAVHNDMAGNELSWDADAECAAVVYRAMIDAALKD